MKDIHVSKKVLERGIDEIFNYKGSFYEAMAVKRKYIGKQNVKGAAEVLQEQERSKNHG